MARMAKALYVQFHVSTITTVENLGSATLGIA